MRKRIGAITLASCLFIPSAAIGSGYYQEQERELVAEIVPVKVTVKAVRISIVGNSATTEVRQIPVTTTTVPKKQAPYGSNCPDYYELAIESGWDENEWEKLDYIIWRESRCQPEVHNKQDPAGGSRGLIQINGFWCRPSRYYPEGYLQSQDALNECSDLFDPQTNLEAGLVIYNYGVENHGCGWGPWSTKNTDWC